MTTDDQHAGVTPDFANESEREKRRQLARMTWIAHGLLIFAALLFAVASYFEDGHPAIAYIAAFAEAAMIGAIADWFAVVALFRHPLGMRFLPHTAIIPANRARIADNLGDFVQGEFFSTQRILTVLRDIDPAQRAATWLAESRNAKELAELFGKGVGYLVSHADAAQAGIWLRERIVHDRDKLDFAGWIASALDIATSGDRHQVVLDQMLEAIDAMLAKPHIRERAEQMLAEALPLYFDTLKIVGGKIAAERIVASLQKLFAEVAADPDHALRHQFTQSLRTFVDRLRTDTTYRDGIAQYVTDTVQSPAFANFVDGVWHDAVRWTETDLAQPTSRLRALAEGIVSRLAHALATDDALRGWINDHIYDSAPPIIERYRPRIGAFISRKMHDWKDEEIVDKLELHIGRDLQFIRLNGTIVGGLAGLALHAVGQWLGR